ncbi:hypothetical protein GALMADRAFT_162429 [Galerina marginata CBS 339.88]|uniref:Uncharacterized protein n=1 Tax=Galerina marginata (strain CBS 339.88) TaxID=685588 RepID=A0A067S470_GALM3|nr:hypothetical protein GALMADRAFT_162429 [Galerina marginata CBS 339.88]
MQSEFSFTAAELCSALPPVETHLTAPTPAAPPDGDYYPLAPDSGYELVADARYKRGYVYVADYNVSKENVEVHGKLLEKVTTPPNVEPNLIGGSFVASPIPGMVQMVPGIPFVFAYHGDRDRLHTVGCVQTLESLSHYPDYPDILRESVKLAKLTWGCPTHSETPEISPIYELPGMKENDRSAKRTDFHEHVHDGSYNLANTVMKGEGLGTFLPAVQANTPTAMSQIATVLTVLHSLFRLIMPKCLSKFEQEITDFHSEFNNVITFGGLEPGGVESREVGTATCLTIFVGGPWRTAAVLAARPFTLPIPPHPSSLTSPRALPFTRRLLWGWTLSWRASESVELAGRRSYVVVEDENCPSLHLSPTFIDIDYAPRPTHDMPVDYRWEDVGTGAKGLARDDWVSKGRGWAELPTNAKAVALAFVSLVRVSSASGRRKRGASVVGWSSATRSRTTRDCEITGIANGYGQHKGKRRPSALITDGGAARMRGRQGSPISPPLLPRRRRCIQPLCLRHMLLFFLQLPAPHNHSSIHPTAHFTALAATALSSPKPSQPASRWYSLPPAVPSTVDVRMQKLRAAARACTPPVKREGWYWRWERVVPVTGGIPGLGYSTPVALHLGNGVWRVVAEW